MKKVKMLDIQDGGEGGVIFLTICPKCSHRNNRHVLKATDAKTVTCDACKEVYEVENTL